MKGGSETDAWQERWDAFSDYMESGRRIAFLKTYTERERVIATAIALAGNDDFAAEYGALVQAVDADGWPIEDPYRFCLRSTLAQVMATAD